MNKNELKTILKVLDRIKDPDQFVLQAKALINKDLAAFEARRGQLREQYETDYPRL